MTQRKNAAVLLRALLGLSLVLCFSLFSTIAVGQQTLGTVSVVAVDPSGGVIPDADLKLVDVSTNDTREAKTLSGGTYSFVNLKNGTYKLTVSKSGFSTQSYSIEVHAGRNTDLKAELAVGSTKEVVEVVGSAVPLIETTSSAINTTITPAQIENLPLSGRNVSAMSRLTAGYNGTWNGLPTSAQGSSIDGVAGASGRWKYYAGADSSSVQPRLESISEMTVATNQLDLGNGGGTSGMSISYVTKRGSNDIHGRIFEDFRNDVFNAKPWSNGPTAAKPKLILNEFGGSVGGPIIKDKLFFFGNFSMSKRPLGNRGSNEYFTASAQAGNYLYGDGSAAAVNVLNTVAAYNAAHGTSFPTTVNPVIAAQLTKINGIVGQGNPETTDDPNTRGLFWYQTAPQTYYYPTVRLDYNLSQKHRLYFSYNQTKMNQPNSTLGWFPNDGKTGNAKSNALTAAVGLESTLTPTLINQFKAGYLYSAAWWPSNDNGFYEPGAQITNWNYGNVASGMSYILPTSRYQPVFNLSDDLTWMKGKHTFTFGFSAYRDANMYWDAPVGTPNVNLGIDDLDPVTAALTATTLGIPSDEVGGARQLYAVLTGRISGADARATLDPKTRQYTLPGVFAYNKLNELQKAWALYFQDSYKLLPNLTLNYGMRWDFSGPNKDVQGTYHSLSAADMWAVSGEWNVFNPGSILGKSNPVAAVRDNPYNAWNVSPQPAFGLAWTPRSNGNILEKMLGGDKTVVRAGYQLRRFTPPQQFVWDTVSNYSMGLFQDKWLSASTSGSAGTFQPGSLSLGQALPEMYAAPAVYSDVINLSEVTFQGGAYSAIDPKIHQPYVQSWNLGVQREVGRGRALEVRYVGNRTVHQWLGVNINEVNVFENGFLDEFNAARANLAINGGDDFGYHAGNGTSQLPIMTASGVNFTNSTFATQLRNGAVGSMASTLANEPDYYCHMVGASFGPCASRGATGTALYPLNFWQANPYAAGSWMPKYVTDKGFSTYNSLQAELRQQQWHGLNYTVNYTFSKTLGAATAGDWTGSFTQWTLRDMRSSYAPAGTDRQHVVNLNATYDLPFGRGKKFLNQGGAVDRVFGGWTISTIYKIQSGTPFRIAGQYQTFNDQTDGGVVLVNGMTAAELQKHVGVYYKPGSSTTSSIPYIFNPIYAKGVIDGGYIVSNKTPGTIGTKLWLHGPRQWYDDIAISKAIPITERVKFKLQAELINAFNHPVFSYSNLGIAPTNASNFGRAYYNSSPRQVEFRANIDF